jgi:hypothetical protein
MAKKPETLSSQMRQLIIDSDVSCYRISKDTGIDRGLLSRFMNKKSNLSLTQFDRLGVYLVWRIVADSNKQKKGK